MIEIIGTAHISKESIEEVRQKIRELKPDVVAVELDEARLKGMLNQREIPVVELIRSKNAMVLLINIILSFIQRKMGSKVGVEPGAEMLAAIEEAKRLNSQIALIDREIRITLKRLLSQLSLREKLTIFKEILISLVSEEEGDLEEEIENVKKSETLEEIMEEVRKISPSAYKVIVQERDAYMAAKLLELSREYDRIVAVVGAGHKNGIEHYLSNPEEIPPLEELTKVPEKKISITKVVKFAIPLAIILLFIIAFFKGISIKGSIYLWLLNHMLPTFLAVLIARGSIYSAIAGMLASPLTSLNPLLAAGWFAGYVEAKVKKVTVGEVSEMFRASTMGELYANRAFKVLLVTALANLGSMLGTFISLPTIILPLYEKIFAG